MSKDFSDFIIMVLDAGERVYHVVHLRNRKGAPIHMGIYPMNGHKYLLNLDRAYRVKWAPWSAFKVAKPYWRNWWQPLVELTRSKKIGLLLYQEPCTMRCSTCNDDDGERCKKLPSIVTPMHISRIHQPSGELRE